jgi:hypothetical protein
MIGNYCLILDELFCHFIKQSLAKLIVVVNGCVRSNMQTSYTVDCIELLSTSIKPNQA